MSWHTPSCDSDQAKSMQRRTKGQLDKGQGIIFSIATKNEVILELIRTSENSYNLTAFSYTEHQLPEK